MIDKTDIDIISSVPDLSYGVGQGKSVDIRSARLTEILTADDKIILTEPSSQSHSQYPYNKVDQSISGHIKEVDDTPGAERLMEMHKSGTYTEINPDGSRVTKIFGEDFYIILDDHNLVVGGNLNITVQGNANLLVKGDMKTKVSGDYELQVHGNMITRVEGAELHYTKGKINYQSGSDILVRSQGKYKIDSKSTLELNSNLKMVFRSSSTGQFYCEGNLNIDGGNVKLNSPSSTDPGKVNIRSRDPSGGLNVPDTVFVPAKEELMKLRTDNKLIRGLEESDKTLPKDRTKI